MKRFLTFLGIFLLFFIAESNAQPTEDWARRYNGLLDSTDVALDLVVDNNGNTYVTGYSSTLLGLFTQIVTISYDSDGTQRWYTEYGGLFTDEGRAIVLDNSQQYVYVTGFVNGLLNLTLADYVIIKMEAATGDTVWVRTYGGLLTDDRATSIAIDGQNNPIITGFSGGILLLAATDYATVKYDQNGNQLWARIYNGPDNKADTANAIAVDNLNNIVVTGSSKNGFLFPTDDDYATVKYNSAGTQQWVIRYDNGSNDRAYAIVIDNSGNVIVTGESENSSNSDYATVKYNTSGNQQWVSRYNYGNNDRAYAIVIDNSGGTIVTGESEQSPGNSDYGTVKYNSSGTQQWSSRYDNGNYDRAYAIVIDNSGNTYVTGASRSGSSAGTEDYLTLKYSAAGNQDWSIRRDGNNSEDRAYAIVIDSQGNVYITGFSEHNELLNSEDYFTIKYENGSNPVTIISSNVPVKNSLSQNYPNPFNPSTNVRFDVLSQSFVNISVYDILGNKIAVLLNNKLNSGTYQAVWNASSFPSGIYFYRISITDASGTHNFSETKKMILAK